MEAMRPPAAGFYPVSAAELGRQPAYDEHESVVTYAPVQLGQLGEQEGYLRAAEHYAVEPAGPSGSHHVTEEDAASGSHHAPDKDGESAFCVQAVAPFATAAAELDKAVSEHEQQYLVSDLGAASYQLSAAGDVYKLVVRDAKQHEAELHHYGQLLPESLSAAPAEHPLPPPTEEEHSPPPPAPSAVPQQHCLVCDLGLANHRVLDIFGNTTHQTSTTYAIKLRQVTGHRANFVYHSEVLCESCASLLNVVDSFEARLREIKNRLEETRAEVQAKFGRTCAHYDEEPAVEVPPPPPPPPPPLVEAPAVKSRKRRSPAGEASPPPTRKKVKGKAGADRDTNYRDKSKPSDPADIAAAPRRRPARKAFDKARVLAEYDEDSPPEPDSFLEEEDDEEEQQHDELDEHDEDEPAALKIEEEADEDEEEPLPVELGADSRPIRVANMCADCGRLFINPMVLRVHQLSHQVAPMSPPPPPQPTAADFIPILEMDNYAAGADDVLAQAVQQMNSPPPVAPVDADTEPVEQADQAEQAAQAEQAEQAPPPADTQDVYKCDSCPGLFKTVQGLQKHHRKEHSRSVWRCFVCWQAVDSLRRLKRHVATHGEQNSCAVCLQPFDSKMMLKLHVTRKHPETQTKNNFCELCSKHFDNQGFLEHARGVHGVGGDPARRFKCGQCGKVLLNSVCYLRHVKVHKKDFNCQYCGKSFNSRTNLDNHERTHTGEKPYFCPDCERTFTSKQVRDIHIRTFHRQNPYACKRCNRRCESKASFIRHMRSHAGVTPYECPVCCKKMTTEYSLKMHIRAIHDRKLPFKCDVCQKSFPYKSSLTLHMNTHSGDKSHICDICGKCFASRGSLRTHMHTHSAEKPYKCEWCDRSFSRKDLLAGHKLQIHGIQPEMNYSRLSKH